MVAHDKCRLASAAENKLASPHGANGAGIPFAGATWRPSAPALPSRLSFSPALCQRRNATPQPTEEHHTYAQDDNRTATLKRGAR
jgi:hypothetical protein